MYSLKDIVDSTLHLLSRPNRTSDSGHTHLDHPTLATADGDAVHDDGESLHPASQPASANDTESSATATSAPPTPPPKPHSVPLTQSASSFSFVSVSSPSSPGSSASTSTNSDLDPASNPSAREIARLRAELRQARDHANALQSALRDAHNASRSKDVLVDQLRSRARRLETDVSEAKRTADERRLELRSVEGFLTKTDRWAGSDLVQAVKDINSEILQFAAAAAEGFPAPVAPSSAGSSGPSSSRKPSGTASRTTPPPAPQTLSPGRRKALERVAARFGSKLRQCLETHDHAADPTLLQYALQACVCQCIAHAVASFCFGSTGKLESHLSKIYQHMHASEPQPTSSRWRALTHSHIRALSPNLDAIAVAEVTDTALRGIANILSAAGFGEVESLLTRAASRHRQQLKRIAELANRFAYILREGTMSTDFQPMFVESVREFSALSMENVYEGLGGSGASRGRVLCTTEIGLQALTNKGRDGKDFSAQTIERRVVLKPRVVLESVVQMLDRDR